MDAIRYIYCRDLNIFNLPITLYNGPVYISPRLHTLSPVYDIRFFSRVTRSQPTVSSGHNVVAVCILLSRAPEDEAQFMHSVCNRIHNNIVCHCKRMERTTISLGRGTA